MFLYAILIGCGGDGSDDDDDDENAVIIIRTIITNEHENENLMREKSVCRKDTIFDIFFVLPLSLSICLFVARFLIVAIAVACSITYSEKKKKKKKHGVHNCNLHNLFSGTLWHIQ